ncbi:DUF6794 domain-containing protein [Luteimonas aquatica]|uniref:DUF6794 domain-containing protein n=1 Tax=Luteimonas aquatica TaxID=450364 RepID=UPI001F564B33|nr:DUF6794 domain-containing protein [Luteimonas aquatica]
MIARIVVMAALLASAMGVRAEEEDKPLGPGEWPLTVEATVTDLAKRMPEPARKQLAAMSREDLAGTHFGIGLYIRNHYGLWRGNQSLLKSACDGSTCHPDDASGKIVEALWQRLQAEHQPVSTTGR